MRRWWGGLGCMVALCLASLLPATAVAHQSEVKRVAEMGAAPLQRLDDRVYLLRDPSARLTIDDVAQDGQRDDFRLARGADLSPGYTGDAIWARLTLRNPASTPQVRFLEVGPPRLRDIRLYQRIDGQYVEQRAGTLVPVRERLVWSRQSVFPLALAPGETATVYLRVTSGNAIAVSTRLWQPAHFHYDERWGDLVNGIQFGAIFLIALYALLLFAMTRDAVFLYFAVTMGGYGVYDATILQYGLEFLWPASPDWNQRSPGVMLALTVAASTFLMSQLLRLPTRWPLMALALTGMGWLALILVPFMLVLTYGRVVPVINLLSFGTVLLSMGLALWSVAAGERKARPLLLAFALFWFTSMLRIAEIFGLLPYDLWVDYAQSWSVVLSGGLMAVVLADNVRVLRARREEAQAEVLAERELSAGRLERQVQERTVQLVEAKEQAEEANRAKSAFLAHMSHELRTPLHSILGYSRLMMEGGLDAVNRRRVESVYRSGTHLLALIEEVLDYARGEAGRLELEPRPAYLGALLNAVIEEAVPLARAGGVELHAVLDPGLPAVVQVDAGRLQQVLGNLLGNACRHGHASRVSLEARVLPEAAGEGRVALWLAVRDDGIGVPAAERERIFRPFEQVSVTATSRGVGLGLPIARAIVGLMGGDLVCECPPQGGSLFHFRVCLPLAGEAELAPVQVPLGLHRYQGAVRRVLVVDDIAENRALLADILAAAGFDLSLAASGTAALDLLRQQTFDAVVVDQFMPGLSGWQVLRRARESGCTVPFLLLSATRPMPPVDWPAALSFAASLMKPVGPDVLVRVVGQILGLDSAGSAGADVDVDVDAGRQETGAPLARPPADLLARLREAVALGQVTDIEEWAEEVLLRHPEWSVFALAVREAVTHLDFPRLHHLVGD